MGTSKSGSSGSTIQQTQPNARPMLLGSESTFNPLWHDVLPVVSDGPYALLRCTAGAQVARLSGVIFSPASTSTSRFGTSAGPNSAPMVGVNVACVIWWVRIYSVKLFIRSSSEGMYSVQPLSVV